MGGSLLKNRGFQGNCLEKSIPLIQRKFPLLTPSGLLGENRPETNTFLYIRSNGGVGPNLFTIRDSVSFSVKRC